jgi:hypothetical protein
MIYYGITLKKVLNLIGLRKGTVIKYLGLLGVLEKGG